MEKIWRKKRKSNYHSAVSSPSHRMKAKTI